MSIVPTMEETFRGSHLVKYFCSQGGWVCKTSLNIKKKWGILQNSKGISKFHLISLNLEVFVSQVGLGPSLSIRVALLIVPTNSNWDPAMGLKVRPGPTYFHKCFCAKFAELAWAFKSDQAQPIFIILTLLCAKCIHGLGPKPYIVLERDSPGRLPHASCE